MGYTYPDAVFTAPGGGVKIDPYDPAFSARTDDPQDPSLPAVYLFSNTPGGDGPAYSIAEDGTVLGHLVRADRGETIRAVVKVTGTTTLDAGGTPGTVYLKHGALIVAHPINKNGYRPVVLMGEGEVPPPDVMERNRRQAEQDHAR